jgi:outer membrane immunogenic protein
VVFVGVRTLADAAYRWGMIMRGFQCGALAAVAVFGLASMASAADMPTKAPMYTKAPVAAPVYNWTGFYVGGNIGYGWGRSTDSATPLPQPSFGELPFSQGLSPSGILGGGQIGYNYQTGAYVWGLEADFQGSDIKNSSTMFGLDPAFPADNNVDNQHLTWFGTVRGRVGWLPVNPLLIYVTGGLIYGEVKTDSLTTYAPIPASTYPGSASSVRTGWTVGGGVEWMFTPKWTAKLEGLYYQIDGQNYLANPLAPNPPFQVAHSFNNLNGGIIRAGVNYHF